MGSNRQPISGLGYRRRGLVALLAACIALPEGAALAAPAPFLSIPAAIEAGGLPGFGRGFDLLARNGPGASSRTARVSRKKRVRRVGAACHRAGKRGVLRRVGKRGTLKCIVRRVQKPKQVRTAVRPDATLVRRAPVVRRVPRFVERPIDVGPPPRMVAPRPFMDPPPGDLDFATGPATGGAQQRIIRTPPRVPPGVPDFARGSATGGAQPRIFRRFPGR